MNIRFLGTSHGVPTPGRHCQSVLIETAQGDYLFDAGAPVMDILTDGNYDFSRLKAVFISHCHPDHFFGLAHMLDLSAWYYRNTMAYTVYMPEQRGIAMLQAFCGTIHKLSDNVGFALVQEGTFYQDDNVVITAIHTDHMRSSTNIAFGFLVESEGKRVYITCDLHPSLEDFPTARLAAGVDAIVAECAHFPAIDLLEKLKTIPSRNVYVVHVHPASRYDDLKMLESRYPELNIAYPDDSDVYPV